MKAIKNCVVTHEQKHRIIDQAIARADQGYFISSDKMHQWIDSWGDEDERNPPEVDLKK